MSDEKVCRVRCFPGKYYCARSGQKSFWSHSTDGAGERNMSVPRFYGSADLDAKMIRTETFTQNNQSTSKDVRIAAEQYLWALWRKGGAAGVSSDEASFPEVRLNDVNANPGASDEIVIAQVGITPNLLMLFCHLMFDWD